MSNEFDQMFKFLKDSISILEIPILLKTFLANIQII